MLEKEIEEKNTEISDLKTQNNTFQSLISEMNQETQRLNYELTESLETTKIHGSQISELSSKIQEFNSYREASLKTEKDQKLEISSLKSEVSNLMKQIKEKDNKVETLECNYTKLEDLLDDIEDDNNKNHDEMKAMHIEVENLRKKSKTQGILIEFLLSHQKFRKIKTQNKFDENRE